jgi:Sensors of blue-light using FAD
LDQDVEPVRAVRKSGRKLLQLVYVSTATRPLTPDDLQMIADVSERHNSARWLTGLLIFQDGFFQGVLEGPEPEVLNRMERVITDNRHRAIRILQERDTLTRRFGNWSFALLPLATPIQSPGEFVQNFSKRLR